MPVAAAGTLVTNPLTVPPIYYAAYHLGAWATGTSATAVVSLTDPASIGANLGAIVLPLFTGLAITASCVADRQLPADLAVLDLACQRETARSRAITAFTASSPGLLAYR